MVVAFARSLAPAALVACVCVSFAADGPASHSKPVSVGQLTLSSGDTFAGRLVDSTEPGVISWQSKIATKPFVFPLEKLKSASMGASGKAAPNQGDFCFELHGGQAIFGSLAEITDRTFVINSPRFGRVELERDDLARFYRAKGARSGLADGLQGLTGWTIEGVESDWREEAGDLVTEVRGASLAQDVEVPRRYYVEIDAEWSRDFGVRFEIGEDFRIDTWEKLVILARQTLNEPDASWSKPDYDDSKWKVGRSGFGSRGEPHVGVIWDTPIIWLRRTFDMPEAAARPDLYIRHDEDADVYINGVHAVTLPNFTGAYETVPMSDKAVAALKPQGNVMAIRCRQTGGGQYIDAGLVSSQGPLVAAADTEPAEWRYMMLEVDGDYASIQGDYASIQQSPDESGGGLRVRCFVDREAGTVTVTDFADNTLATVKLAPNAAPEGAVETLPLRISSYCNRLRLKQLVLNEWVGNSTKLEAGGQLLVRLNDGRTLMADAVSMDQGGQQLDVEATSGDKTIDFDNVASVTFAPRNYGSSEPYWANLRDGTVLCGAVKGIQNDVLTIRSTISSRDLSIPVDDLLSLSNVSAAGAETSTLASAAAQADSDQERGEPQTPHLDAEGMSSYGELVESAATDDALGLSWKPVDSATASPLRRDAHLRIVLRTIKQETSAAATNESPLAALYRAQGLTPPVETMDPEAEKRRAREAARGLDADMQYLVLVNGDRIACQVTRFDATGVYVASDSFSESFIPARQIRIWETNRDTWLDGMREAKRRRMMTLPRKQREVPPTHLVESVTGDFMRTRLVRGDEQAVYAAIQREERGIDRSKIQRIVWLPDSDPKSRKNPPAETGDLAVSTDAKPSVNAQLIVADEVQLTMYLERLQDARFVGKSTALGQCKVSLDDVAELRLGDPKLAENDKVVDSKWRLRDAIDPLYMQDQVLEEQGILTAGLTFPLVGKPAPEISAPTLAGEALRLEELKGQVVVLDFWATWCGPCIQNMPELVSVVNSYDDSKVRMIAINLGEDKEAIADCLARLNLSPNVAIDADRRISEKYLVKSIPQTVVIGPNGDVARVFVGTTPSFHKQLKFAIDELLMQ